MILILGVNIDRSFAQGVVTFGPKETKIEGSIPYTVIGKYRAQFRAFKGRITLDERSLQIQSVYLKIGTASIISNCPWCDKMARSRRLLNAAKYPNIIFKSDKIIQDQTGYKVKGVLEMHGISKRMLFPFKVSSVIDPNTKQRSLVLSGSWVIDRKDFHIIWNKYLDHGGVLVGDDLTVKWGIKMAVK